MSIVSEIQRLQTDSDAIASAISVKGVTVPSGSGFDDYASLIASIPTGGDATLQSKTASPSTSQQVVTADSGYDGLSQVTISAVTSAIDPNIVAGNIKSGISILGVTGNYSGGGSVLPYTPLEYIETDGTAYINSGVIAKATMSFDLKVKMNSSISNSEIFVGVGSTDGASGTLNGLWRSSTNQGKIGYGYYYIYSGILTPSSFANPFEVSTRLLKGSCVMGIKEQGSSSYTSASNNRTSTVSSSAALFIFATNVSGSPSSRASAGSRIYYIRIISGGSLPNLAFDGVPALYNGEYGLWDRVSNTFFGNAAGSGAFTGV